jgi:hypothetical protein
MKKASIFVKYRRRFKRITDSKHNHLHPFLGYKSPNGFERQFYMAKVALTACLLFLDQFKIFIIEREFGKFSARTLIITY